MQLFLNVDKKETLKVTSDDKYIEEKALNISQN